MRAFVITVLLAAMAIGTAYLIRWREAQLRSGETAAAAASQTEPSPSPASDLADRSAPPPDAGPLFTPEPLMTREPLLREDFPLLATPAPIDLPPPLAFPQESRAQAPAQLRANTSLKRAAGPEDQNTPTPTPAPAPPPTPAATPEEEKTEGAPYRVQIIDGQDQPISGATMLVAWAAPGGSSGSERARSGASGWAEVVLPEAGAIQALAISADGYQSKRMQDVPRSSSGLAVRLEANPAIRGRAANLAGAPIQGGFTAMLLALPGESAAPGNGQMDLSRREPRLISSKRFSSPDGSFEFSDVPPGTYVAAVWTDDARGGVSAPFQAGSSAEAIGVVADRGAAIQGQTRQSSGAGEASALPGASVTALNLTAALANADYTPRQASADEQGRFSITDLPGGVYEIIAAGPDGPIEDPSQSCRVLPAGAAIRADFESKTAAARGRLIVNVAGEDGAALQGANLTLILDAPGGTRRQAQCGAAGQAAFDNLAEGEYQLAVSHPSDGARSKMLGIHFQGGADQTLSIRFHERKQVTGRVLRAGQPAGAGVVRFTMKRDADYDLRGGLIAAPISPATGEFEAWLEPGLYEIGIAGAEPRPLQIDAGPGPVQPLLIEAP